MPDASGLSLYRLLRRRAPAVAARMVLMTGGADGALDEQVKRSRVPVLDKPFAKDALERLLPSS